VKQESKSIDLTKSSIDFSGGMPKAEEVDEKDSALLQFYKKFMHNFTTVLNNMFDQNYTLIKLLKYQKLLDDGEPIDIESIKKYARNQDNETKRKEGEEA